jgi:hypothetical protein
MLSDQSSRNVPPEPSPIPLLAGMRVFLRGLARLWFRIIRARWLFAGIALALVTTHFALQLDTNWEQDACSFGPVSNARYRELLAEAKRKQKTEWAPLVRDHYRASILLNARFDDLSRGMTTVYERLAAMHALVRALGADYRGAFNLRKDPYDELRSGVWFRYHLDLNRLGWFAPFLRRAAVSGGVYGPGETRWSGSPTDPTRYERGAVSFSVLLPTLIETVPYSYRSQYGDVCPPVPTPEQAQYFTPAHQ